MSVDLQALGERVMAAMPEAVGAVGVRFGELTLEASRAEVIGLLRYLRDTPGCEFTTLVDLCGVDHPGRAERFDVVYHLLSMTRNQRIRVRVRVGEQASVPSLVGVFPAADWYEREAFDLYGITFEGHPDLRRILTDYGFSGHPLRKDFPLTGHVEVRWDEGQKRVVYEPVQLNAEYRNFDFESPWEGIAALPGDEKAKG
jgi:NADH-quinone oxidoreductase subunit C